ncbi:MAG: tRNA preQ1(34) S-adenosylmethionine ribosyltransferase-isomerase QueA [Cyanobium sp.]
MTSPEDWLLTSYDYPLPPEAIAQRPAEPRHSARLLVVEPDQGSRHHQMWDWAEELRPGDLMVVNDTRVLQARLQARRSSGGAVEVLVLEPWSEGVPATPADPGSDWLCLLKPAKRVKLGEVLELEPPQGQDDPTVPLQVVGHHAESGGRVVRFPPGLRDAPSLEPFLQRYGSIPLPPYIHGTQGLKGDRYQTRYATQPGAVAAPTAGLHLSDALLQRLQERGVVRATVTLHVGLGTFRPLEQERLEGLELHSEWVEVTPELVAAVEAARLRGGRVVAVGTTSVRSLEGVAALHGGQLRPYRGPVNLVIQPGFRFQVVQGLLTNFHLPKSSLLLLVSALIGRERLLDLYGEALRLGYRFFSFGDAMWIPPEAVVAGGAQKGS